MDVRSTPPTRSARSAWPALLRTMHNERCQHLRAVLGLVAALARRTCSAVKQRPLDLGIAAHARRSKPIQAPSQNSSLGPQLRRRALPLVLLRARLHARCLSPSPRICAVPVEPLGASGVAQSQRQQMRIFSRRQKQPPWRVLAALHLPARRSLRRLPVPPQPVPLVPSPQRQPVEVALLGSRARN